MEWHAGGMRKTIYPFADKQKIRYSRALLVARILWKLKFDGFTATEAGRTSSDSREFHGKKSPRDTSMADALLPRH
jgi:hypothetical protein